MFEVSDIREWRGHEVLDSDGHRIGTMESVYVDTATDQPAFATITVGLPTRRRLVFVPLAGATVGPGYLKVAFTRKAVKSAPSMGTDDVLAAEDEPPLFAHYDLTHQPGPGGERRLARR
ncbi:photosystem reaction center subunit H [Streptomyces sp. RSD-27]|nr:photosystem reaction center subunit H [Streptomyces sp. RSD-27]